MSHITRRHTGRTIRSTTRAGLLISSLSLVALPLLAPPGAGSSVARTPQRAAPPTSLSAPTPPSAAACRAPLVGPAPTVAPEAQERLNGIRVARHDAAGFDRIVFDLTGIPGYQVHRTGEVVEDGSGNPIEMRGRSYLTVRLEPAAAHSDDGQSTSPRRILRSFRTLREVRRAGDFEAVVTYGLGLRRTRDYRVFTAASPARLVVDVAHRGQHPFDCRAGVVQVVFATSEAMPSTVERRVPTPAVMHGALTALYAGPTDYDRPDGLSFVSSDSSGFTDLRVRNGIARVRLTGGCDSGGSTFTVANEIVPTLKQFASVDAVKIYGPRGHTERPRGRSDSIPTCLEP